MAKPLLVTKSAKTHLVSKVGNDERDEDSLFVYGQLNNDSILKIIKRGLAASLCTARDSNPSSN